MSIKGDISISGNRPPRKTLAKKPTLKPEIFRNLFKVFEDAAVKGERCPQRFDLQNRHHIPVGYKPSALADIGWIRIEIYRQNWRVVEIRTGPNIGARTQEPPAGGKPYKVIASSGAA